VTYIAVMLSSLFTLATAVGAVCLFEPGAAPLQTFSAAIFVAGTCVILAEEALASVPSYLHSTKRFSGMSRLHSHPILTGLSG
jgi:hypothetical protein